MDNVTIDLLNNALVCGIPVSGFGSSATGVNDLYNYLASEEDVEIGEEYGAEEAAEIVALIEEDAESSFPSSEGLELEIDGETVIAAYCVEEPGCLVVYFDDGARVWRLEEIE